MNNAGWDDFMPFIATSEEFWDKILDINFKGALRVTQAALPGMIERKFGRIINIGSDAGPGRLVPRSVGPAVAFFASDAAAFITGQTLSVSGGLTMA